MSRKGNCYDNSIMESFFGVMMNEMYYGLEDTYKSFVEFKKAIDEYTTRREYVKGAGTDRPSSLGRNGPSHGKLFNRLSGTKS